jgi:hypothetical protein
LTSGETRRQNSIPEENSYAREALKKGPPFPNQEAFIVNLIQKNIGAKVDPSTPLSQEPLKKSSFFARLWSKTNPFKAPDKNQLYIKEFIKNNEEMLQTLGAKRSEGKELTPEEKKRESSIPEANSYARKMLKKGSPFPNQQMFINKLTKRKAKKFKEGVEYHILVNQNDVEKVTADLKKLRTSDSNYLKTRTIMESEIDNRKAHIQMAQNINTVLSSWEDFNKKREEIGQKHNIKMLNLSKFFSEPHENSLEKKTSSSLRHSQPPVADAIKVAPKTTSSPVKVLKRRHSLSDLSSSATTEKTIKRQKHRAQRGSMG